MNLSIKQKLYVSIIAGVIPLFSLHLPFTSTATLFSIYALFIMLAFLTSATLFKNKPFYSAKLVVTGIFIGICIDLILFPKVNGFERNLFPVEIALHTIIGGVICYICALIWYITNVKNNKNT